MLVVMHHLATQGDIDCVVERIRELGLEPHILPGSTRTAIGITGNTSAIEPDSLAGLTGIKELIRVTRPYKLASREMKAEDTSVAVSNAQFGPRKCTIVAGPCSIENEAMAMRTAEFLLDRGVRIMRGGAFKPRTSPYSFQGLGQEGLDVLQRLRERTGIGIVTEIMDASQLAAVEQAADMLQIGARNMQNFTLLRSVSASTKPVLLKRGISATLEEWLMAAEYVLCGGNRQIVMCERGVRTFADHTRNTLDLSVVPSLKEVSHLPIIVDPSHGTGHRNYVSAMAKAALAAGADGLMIEVHPDPDHALSDGAQTLNFEQFDRLLVELKELAAVLGKSVV